MDLDEGRLKEVQGELAAFAATEPLVLREPAPGPEPAPGVTFLRLNRPKAL